MLKRRTWPACAASLAGALLMSAALIAPPGASAASAGRPGAPAGRILVPHHACRFRGQRDQSCYRAARGYDMATGLGTPQAGYLVTDLLHERRS